MEVPIPIAPIGSSKMPSWGYLGPLLERSWGQLGALLGPSWGCLGLFEGHLDASRAHRRRKSEKAKHM
eukprot:5242152-Pyramimonas_sp.AAC.1